MVSLFFLLASDVQVHALHLLPGLCSPLFCAYLDLVWVLKDPEPVELVEKIVVGVHHCGLLGVRRVDVEVGVHHENPRLEQVQEHVQLVHLDPSPPPQLHVLVSRLLAAFSLTPRRGEYPQTAACTPGCEGIRRSNGLVCSTLWPGTLCILGSGRAFRRQSCRWAPA